MKLSEVTEALVGIIKGVEEIKAVYVGDETNIATAPVVIVDPTDRTRELYSTGRRTQNTYNVTITILYSKMGDPRDNRLDSMRLAETIEDTLNASFALNGQIVSGYVTGLENGFSERRNSLYVATQLTWEGMSVTTLEE